MAETNPLRYRGYYFDTESGFYYLQSRYYDPSIGRFVNADSYSSTGQGIIGSNMFAYCGNNSIARKDSDGEAFETVFDVVSLGLSIAEVAANPYDPMAWIGLVGDAVDLIPFVTGVGETVRGLRFVDKVGNTLEIAKAVDFTDNAYDIARNLDRSTGFTKSSISAGKNIHKGYKVTDEFAQIGKEYSGIKGMRPDYIDFDNKTIYELKPKNQRSMRNGVHQLQRYNRSIGGGYKLRLELY